MHQRSGEPSHDLYLRRQLIDLGEGVVNGAFGSGCRGNGAVADRGGGEEAL